jgi:hypothetical protein
VTTTRRFRNAEEASIEAAITFPVPVHATLFDLAARIGERRRFATSDTSAAAASRRNATQAIRD